MKNNKQDTADKENEYMKICLSETNDFQAITIKIVWYWLKELQID